ncbi:MAG TPA: RNA methyltransferase [Burkholderiaceae bacterium]|nr:RNA methyltransferase [Burkholderiaceae bacterium]
MKQITSRDNPLYKELKQLASSSQARRKSGRSLLDGIHLAQAYLQHVGLPLLCVASESAQADPEVAALLARCASADKCIVLADTLYRSLSQVENGTGPLLLIDVPPAQAPAALTQSAVLLDQLQDPGNLGSILRSAAGAGIRQVYCSPGTVFAWSPKVLRAGMGAHFLLEIFENQDLTALAQAARIPLLATSSHARQTLYETDLTRPVAWLFGHEGQGVRPELLALASQQLAIPQSAAIESLNVAAAAAVCFFEQVRQSRR